jgi:exodeoxyribonuclease VII large subunit
MPEEIKDRKVFTLMEVMQSIRKTLAARYTSSFWIKAEMNKLNFYPHSGHCYPDLVEKENGKLVAQVRSVLWRDDYLRVSRAFQAIVKEPLKDGIKILLCATITFDPSYGLSLRILDIDAGYSLGDLEQEKAHAIATLKKEGVYDKNKLSGLPLLPKRIAIISVNTSKGYADFMQVIEGNEWGYKFNFKLFPALLQGEKAIDSLIGQLHRIKEIYRQFDVVAIIRGGGADIGLSCYNNLRLAKEVAMFPLPVITGIGHSTNETVVEMVAFENAITPTKLAEFLIQTFHNYSVPLHKAEEKLVRLARKILKDEQVKFNHTTRYFNSVSRNLLANGNNSLLNLRNALMQQSRFYFKSGVNELNNMERTVNNLSPENVLRRGYSITLLNGKSVKSTTELHAGDRIQTVVADGLIESKVV